MKSSVFFSVVIPTLNEEKYLPRLLKDLAAQTFTNFEVIHVDGQSEDLTVPKAKAFTKQFTLTQLTATRRNVSYQRNQGARHAQGTWLLFMDADNRLPPTFLEAIFQQLEIYSEIDLFTTWISTHSRSPVYQTMVSVVNMALDVYRAIGKPTSFGALIGCRREIFKVVQFDEKQKVLEDVLFVNEAVKKKYHFHIFHEPRYDFSLRRVQKEGLWKIFLQVMSMQRAYLMGEDFQSSDHGYVMKGGIYYHQGGKNSFPPSSKIKVE